VRLWDCVVYVCLSLSNNPFDTFPNQIFELHNLEKLFLEEIGLDRLPTELLEMKSLNYIGFSGNEWTELPEFWKNQDKIVIDI